MQKQNFTPRVVLNHCFASNKPDVAKLIQILPAIESFYATNIHPDIEAHPEVATNNMLDKITAYNGHIVLRVAPGGDSFYVYMLDDNNFKYRVKSIHGPYKSK